MEVSGQFHAPAALPLGKDSGAHWIGDWVGIGNGLDGVMRRIAAPAGIRTPVF
jgi:hypothetical protein